MSAISSQNICTDCGAQTKQSLWTFWKKGEYGCDREGCTSHLCESCHNKHPLFVPSSDDAMLQSDLNRATLKKFCKACFQEKSTIDFSTTYDAIQGMANSNVTFVFVHGGSGSREMFKPHATELRERYGHGSVLLDLPGHASLVEMPLSLESCADTLETVVNECDLVKRKPGHKLVYVGGSLGAYIGFYLLDKFQDTFDGAILIDCGQNVGPGASYKARIGLVMLSWMGSKFSNATLFVMMRDVTAKSEADYKLMETVFGAGMFFDQARQQVNCLRAVAPADYIPNLRFPILFMNGSKDYRDSENKWLELCVNEKSELRDYEGGDHFFTHYKKFVDDILTRWNDFAEKL